MCAADFACERKGFRCSARCCLLRDGHCCAVLDRPAVARSEQYLDPYFVGFQLCCALSLLVLWQWVFDVLAGEEFEVRKQEQIAVVEQEQRAFPSISESRNENRAQVLINTCARE